FTRTVSCIPELCGLEALRYGRLEICATSQAGSSSARSAHRGARTAMVIARRLRFCNSGAVLRPRKKYTVHDLQQLKGKGCLTHVHVKSPEEAAAADAAGVDLLSCSFDSPEAQARLPRLVAAAPHSFLSAASPHGLASPEEAIR